MNAGAATVGRLRRIGGARRMVPKNVRALGWVSFANDLASELIYPLATCSRRWGGRCSRLRRPGAMCSRRALATGSARRREPLRATR